MLRKIAICLYNIDKHNSEKTHQELYKLCNGVGEIKSSINDLIIEFETELSDIKLSEILKNNTNVYTYEY